MATAEEIQDSIKWDLDRLPVGVDEKASERALGLLDELGSDSVIVGRVAAYARQDVDHRAVTTDDFLRALQQADGRLALVTWSSGGITSIGFDADSQRFEEGGYSAVRDIMGDECEFHNTLSRREAKDALKGRRPDVVHRDEADLLDADREGSR